MYHITKLAEKGRSAGVHLVFAAQYPTKETMPRRVTQNCRRVGLAAQDEVASRVIIDAPGLELINTKGRGMMTAPGGGKGYVGFRGLYLRAPDESRPDEPDDRARLLAVLPKAEHGPSGSPGARPEVEAPTLQPDWAAL